MKILISVDIEGISGVVNPIETDTNVNNPAYQKARKWCTDDVNAAIRGAIEGGADTIVVNDSHGSSKLNIIYEELHPIASLVRGGPNILLPYDFMTGLDSSFDAVFLIGWHDKIGGPGILSHSYTSKNFNHIKVNGKSFGEVEFAMRLTGIFGVPIVLITGDDIICSNTRKELGKIEIAPVKRMISRFAAECLSYEEAHNLIETAAKRAVERTSRGEFSPFVFGESEFKLEIETHDTAVAQGIARIPGIEYDGCRTVSFRAQDFKKIYDMYMAMYFIMKTVANETY